MHRAGQLSPYMAGCLIVWWCMDWKASSLALQKSSPVHVPQLDSLICLALPQHRDVLQVGALLCLLPGVGLQSENCKVRSLNPSLETVSESVGQGNPKVNFMILGAFLDSNTQFWH